MNKKFFTLLFSLFLSINFTYADIINDELVEETLKGRVFDEIEVNTGYNYESTDRTIIKLQIQDTITTKENPQEGGIIIFKVKQNVKFNKEVIVQKGTIATGRIKTYTTRGLNGIPGQIIIDDFKIPDIDSRKLKSTYIHRGLDLTIMVLPIKWALTPIPFVGSFTNLIIGGHGKITPNDTITLYYYPNWNVK